MSLPQDHELDGYGIRTQVSDQNSATYVMLSDVARYAGYKVRGNETPSSLYRNAKMAREVIPRRVVYAPGTTRPMPSCTIAELKRLAAYLPDKKESRVLELFKFLALRVSGEKKQMVLEPAKQPQDKTLSTALQEVAREVARLEKQITWLEIANASLRTELGAFIVEADGHKQREKLQHIVTDVTKQTGQTHQEVYRRLYRRYSLLTGESVSADVAKRFGHSSTLKYIQHELGGMRLLIQWAEQMKDTEQKERASK